MRSPPSFQFIDPNILNVFSKCNVYFTTEIECVVSVFAVLTFTM